jgi:hypothetical protein
VNNNASRVGFSDYLGLVVTTPQPKKNSSFMVTSASGNLSALEQLPNKDGLHNYWIALKGGWKRQNNMIAILLYIIVRSSKWWLLDGI